MVDTCVRFKGVYGLPQMCRIMKRVSHSRKCMAYSRCRILERVSDPMGCVAYHR